MSQMKYLLLEILVAFDVNAQSSCTNLVPGVLNMALGVDLSIFDTWNPVYAVKLGPVQNITCNQNITWQNPISGIIYDVPDQLSSKPIEIPKDVAKYESFMLETSYQLEVDMAVSIHEKYMFGMASKTESMSNAYKYTSEEYRFLGVANSTITCFQMSFLPHNYAPDVVGLSERAQNGIDSLPPIFNSSTVSNYEEFIGYFGTHYCTDALAGGSFRCYYYTQKLFTSVMDTLSIEAQGGYKLSGFLQKSGAVSVTIAPVAQEWINATKIECNCFGGAACPDSQASYQTWATQIYSDPWLLDITYQPIYQLISDPIKQQSMSLAVSNHFARSYLEYEVIPALNIFSIMLKHSLIISGDPNCTAPANTVGHNPSNGGYCGTKSSDGHDCCNPSLNGHYCADKTGALFQTDVNNVKTQISVTNNTINSLLKQANVLLAEPIINITQLTIFGTQFVDLVNIMESPPIQKNCTWDKPDSKCGHDSHQGGKTCGGWIYCGCNAPPSDCGFDTACPITPTPNTLTTLSSLDHP